MKIGFLENPAVTFSNKMIKIDFQAQMALSPQYDLSVFRTKEFRKLKITGRMQITGSGHYDIIKNGPEGTEIHSWLPESRSFGAAG